MSTIQQIAYARAGIIGNPSDGYFGQTIATLVKNFHAEVTLVESDDLVIEPSRRDHTTFKSMEDLVEDIQYTGYYGGVRLLKAAIKKFHEYLIKHQIEYSRRNFTVSYNTDIPMRVGLAGSSAIVTAAMRALMEFHKVEIPKAFLPTLVLRVETEELGLGAGLQDRVVQTFGGCVYMDFEREHLQEYQYGLYEELDVKRLPPLYVAYRDVLAEGTEVVHNDLRARWEKGDPEVRAAMVEFARLTELFYKALKEQKTEELSMLMNANFDLRASIMEISKANWRLINAARNVEASAKFCGSGGAIVGIYRDEAMFHDLQQSMAEINAEIVKVQH